MEKIEISKEQRERIVENAGIYTFKAAAKYLSCAPGTLQGILDAFREEGIELMSREAERAVFLGMEGLHGGTAMTGVGTCGGVSAACFLISYTAGVEKDELEANPALDVAACLPGAVYVIDRFEEEYGAFDCLRLRYNRVQRAVDFLDPDARFWELLFAVSQRDKCGAFSDRDLKESNHPVINAARWGAEGICDLLEMEPAKRKEIPSDMQYPNVEEIEKKIAPVLREMGFPDEKTSYRDRRKAWLGLHKKEI